MNTEQFINQFEKIDIKIYGVRVPEFEVSSELRQKYEISADSPNSYFLRALCYNGLKNLVPQNTKDYDKYGKRLSYELEVIEELSFTDYILLVWDVIRFCKSNGITTGMGRGSSAGSLVCYLIGITKINPLKYGLFFERFISKVRAKKKIVDGITYLDGSLMCDIDNDIDYYRRGEVINYVEEKYKGKTSKLITFNTFSGRLLIKECGKVVGNKKESEMNEISDMIPKHFGTVSDIKEAYEEKENFKKWCDKNIEVYNIALKLRNLIKNKSVHASGLLVSYYPLEDSVPMELSSDKQLVCGFDMDSALLSNLKLDLLGLRCLSVIKDVCEQINVKIEDIDSDDPTIYQNLYDLKMPHGLFQIEADTNFRVVRKVKPKNIQELSACLAIARPGALQFVERYANFTNNNQIESIHPFFDDVLKDTGGYCLYQEQLLRMLNKIGFSLDESEICRKIVGKKELAKVKEWEQKIKDKVQENKLEPEIADIVWKILNDSASYSFNFSHSVSYSVLAAYSVFLKFNYPKEFFLSLLKMTKFEPDPIGDIATIHQELESFGIKLLPPHIIKSDMDFTIEGNDIRFGLLSIKGVAEKTMERLNNFRNRFSNKFEIFAAADENSIPLSVLSLMIQAGVLEGYTQSRTKVNLEGQVYKILTQKEKKYCVQLAQEYDFDLLKIIKDLTERIKDEKGKPIIGAKRFETIKRKYEPYKQIYLQNSKSEKLANYFYETKLLGYSYSHKLRDIYLEKEPDLVSISQIYEQHDDNVIFVGTIDALQESKSKKGKKYMKLKVSDETGAADVILFDWKMDSCISLNNRLPEEEDIVIIRGQKKEDVVFADNIGIQTQRIYTKLSELKSDKTD